MEIIINISLEALTTPGKIANNPHRVASPR